MTRYALWGEGAVLSQPLRGLLDEQQAEYSDRAHDVALAHGYPEDCEGTERWVLEVEAEEADLDAATRHERAVDGYAEVSEVS